MLARISNGKWIAGFTTTIHAGESSAFLCQADETPYDSPTQVPAWKVYSGSAWEEQETLRVEAPLLKEEIGVRVRRGPSWKWGDQDGGPGSTGVTIPDSHAGWVGVLWDSGQAGYRYRVGAEDAYDLSVVEQGRPPGRCRRRLRRQEQPHPQLRKSGNDKPNVGVFVAVPLFLALGLVVLGCCVIRRRRQTSITVSTPTTKRQLPVQARL